MDGKKRRVRCLGPGKEHWFMSANPTYHRICEKCSVKVKHVKELPVFKVEKQA